ncbi:MAG: helix-turn-helix domain-containing protein [Rhodobacteraceae bacterium]|nr:helix-turn-helix domain-containing protein [Paracoccaceae bacterium]
MNQEFARNGLKSIEVAGTILRAMVQAHGPVKLSELSRTTGMPTAKLRRYLISMIHIGIASQNPVNAMYDLGPLSMEIGLQSFSRFDVLKQADQTLEEIVSACGETAAIGQLAKDGPRFVRVNEPTHSWAYSLPPNHVCSLTYTATGLLFCAYSDAKFIQENIAEELSQNRLTGRPNAPHSAEELHQRLQKIRQCGHSALEDGGNGASSAVSVPVLNAEGQLAFALTVFAHVGRLNLEPDGAFIEMVVSKARVLSEHLGYGQG